MAAVYDVRSAPRIRALRAGIEHHSDAPWRDDDAQGDAVEPSVVGVGPWITRGCRWANEYLRLLCVRNKVIGPTVCRGKLLVVVLGVHEHAEAELFHVTHAGGGTCSLSSLAEHGKQDGGNDRYEQHPDTREYRTGDGHALPLQAVSRTGNGRKRHDAQDQTDDREDNGEADQTEDAEDERRDGQAAGSWRFRRRRLF